VNLATNHYKIWR